MMQERKWMFVVALIGALVFGSFTQSDKYGLEQATPIGSYLNGQLLNSHSPWKTETAFNGLTFDFPVWMKQIPGSEQYLITQKEGQIWLLDNENDMPSKRMLLNISAYVNDRSDAGMFDVAFHPDFGKAESPNKSFIYVAYNFVPEQLETDPIKYTYSYNRISRFTIAEDFSKIEASSELVLIQQFDRQVWHSGGAMFFDKYGFLNISMGDEGGSNDEFNNSQLINKRLFGGILRIDVDQDASRSHPIRRFPKMAVGIPEGWPSDIYANYFIPNDNPWVSESEDWLEEFYVIGLRSPHTVFYDSTRDEIWVADVGQGEREEISVFTKGGNGQWPYKEGTFAGPKPKPDTVYGMEVEPLYDYGREVGKTIIGGFIYNGSRYPELQGKYLFGDYISQDVWALDRDTKEVEFLTNTATADGNLGFASFGSDDKGNIYLLQLFSPTINSGTILKLVANNQIINEAPKLLSQLGAFKNLETLEPNDGIIPYDLNTELYSDGALKKRWIAVPNDGNHDTNNEQIKFLENDDWQFPSGTVLIKHFELPKNEQDLTNVHRVETRFLVVEEDGSVYGLTYKWNEEGTDAELLTAAEEKTYSIQTLNNDYRMQQWKFPSPSQCLSCHTNNSGGVLGIKTHTLNKEIHYPESGTIDNQIRAWNHIHLFDKKMSERKIEYLPKSASINDDEASNELKVRSYIDVNCSFCHRPNGVEVDFDARFTTHLKNQKLINGKVVSRNSTNGASVIAPKDTLHSEMFRRIVEGGPLKMPPLGRDLKDKAFVKVLRDWIMELDTVEVLSNNAVLFPNPLVGEKLSIDLSDQLISDQQTSVKIFSSNGSLVYEKHGVFLRVIELQVQLERGTYVVIVSNENGSESLKLVKN